MGLISKIKEFLENRELKRKAKMLEDATTKGVREFLAAFEETEKIEDINMRNREQYDLIKKLASKVESGEINLGGTEKEIQEDSFLVIQRYFKNNSKISGKIQEIREKNLAMTIQDELSKNVFGPNFIKTIEDLVLEIIKESQTGKKDLMNVRVYSRKQKYDMILGLLKKYCSEYEYRFEFKEYAETLDYLYSVEYIRDIKASKDDKEKQRLYEEYINDFLGGREPSHNEVVKTLKNEPFIVRREKIRKCKKYGIEYSKDHIITIYEATEEKKEGVYKKNRERAYERMGQEATSSDLACVRATYFFPRHGVVETVDKHIMPLMEESFFDKEIKEAGLNPADYKLATFLVRGTSHWALNGLVGSHAEGKFENRPYIIIQRGKILENHKGVKNINEADTFFEEDVKLTEDAIILMPLERYKEECKDPKRKEMLKKYNIVLFVGDEKLAVQMILQDMGYVFEDVATWGWEFELLDDIPPEQEYAMKLRGAMRNIVMAHRAEGRKVSYQGIHSSSRYYVNDGLKRIEYKKEKWDLFLKILFKMSGVPFSVKYLKAHFVIRDWFGDVDKLYKEYLGNQEEPPGIKLMSPQEVFDAIGPERLKEITEEFNRIIMEEHKRARAEKDKQLIEKGLITPKDIESEESEEIEP